MILDRETDIIQINNNKTNEKREYSNLIEYTNNKNIIMVCTKNKIKLYNNSNEVNKQMLREAKINELINKKYSLKIKDAKFINKSEIMVCVNRKYPLLYNIQQNKINEFKFNESTDIKKTNKIKLNDHFMCLFNSEYNKVNTMEKQIDTGTVQLLDAKSKISIESIRMGCSDIVDVEFNKNDSNTNPYYMYVLNSRGTLSVLDLRMINSGVYSDSNKVVMEYTDKTLFKCNKLAVSPPIFYKNNTQQISIGYI